jgi:hypothetical protein
MKQSKKGIELALNVVVFAVIALIVLVVVIFIFGGKSAIFSKGVSTCETLGGECSDTNCLTGTPSRPALNGECPKDSGKPFCCAKIFG